jgi:hypothetical protein
MLGVQFHKTGNLSAVRAAIKRADPEVIYREVFGPFMQWVLRERIPKMYSERGRVAMYGQPAWLALSKWTIASKGQGSFIGGAGKGGTVTAPMQTAQMDMARSYRTGVKKTGPASFRFEMTNAARSRSKWSPGFDYPSALHAGWGPYTVRPRPDGPGFLAWRMKAQTIGAGTGRATVGRFGLRKKASVDNGWVRAQETHPSGAPARPHIKWFRLDIIALGERVTKFVFRGIRTPPSVQP